jgi:putative heme-binding domain-containing protein
MRRSLLILPGICSLSAFSFAADLKPDATTDIPDSAKRPVVVALGKSQISDLKSQIPKATLPEGMELQLAAAAPLVTHPIMGCLDNRGRLFVGDATGVNWNKAQLEKNPPNRVLMLEDTDKDGVFDKSTIFADKMTFPQGACWLNGSLYVGSPPSIWKLTDTDNDGVADKREEIVTGFDYTGNAADIHGPFLHPNGRLYWCHGRKGHVVKQKDGTVVHEGLASGIWSCKPDGSDVQWHSLACGDNPVEIDFTPDGDIIGVQNLYYSQPRGDTIVHWLYGGVYERADQMKAIEGLPRTLEHMPVMYNFGHVAVSGCCFGHSPAWSADFSPHSLSNGERERTDVRAPCLNFFVTHFNTQRVVRMELTPEGATYKATEHEFLRLPESPDVHFTDVMEDADGSLLVLDTGGWFRIGCPSSLMAKPDIAGAVYRVKKAGQPMLVKTANPAWKMGKPAWQLHDEKEIVPQLESSNPHSQLCACEAAAKLKPGSPAIHHALLKLLAQPADAALEHAITYAAMMNRLPALSELGKAKAPLLLRRLLVVADNTAENDSARDTILGIARKHLDSDDQDLARVALNVVTRHANADESVAPSLAEWLKSDDVSPARLKAIEGFCRAFLAKPETAKLLGLVLSHGSAVVRQTGWNILAAQASGIANDAWFPPMEKALAEATPGDLPLLLDAIKTLRSDRFNAKLQTIADDAKQPLPLRLKALDAMKGGKMTPKTFALLQDVLTGSNASAAAHIQAAEMLATAPLDATQTTALAPALASVGPVELKQLVGLVKKNKDEAILRTLALEIAKNPVIGSIQESGYRTAFADKPTDLFENIVLPAFRKASDLSEAKKRLLPSLAEKAAAKGRPEEGHKNFELGKGTCIACHKIGNAGRPIGPDLSKIGAIRTERDLLESIMFPSNTLARDYEAHIIETSDGQSVMGVIKSHTAEGLLVVDVAGQEKNVPHANIVADTTLTTSLMPMGLDGTLTEQELCDLVAWLRSLR